MADSTVDDREGRSRGLVAGGDTLRLLGPQSSIVSLARLTLALDLRPYEGVPPERLRRELLPQLDALVRAAWGLVDDAGVASSRRAPASGAVTPSPAVDDAAFIARLELRGCVDRLEGAAGSDRTDTIIEASERVLRHVRRALVSLDHALADEGAAPVSRVTLLELDVGLRVRAALARLRRRVLAGRSVTDDTLYVRARAAGTAIAMLVGDDAYTHVRVGDRRELLGLQRRLLDWMQGVPDPGVGMQIWQDLAGVLEMLRRINARPELAEHDARVLTELTGRVGAHGTVDDATFVTLARLEGLDDELDGLLLARVRVGSAWRTVLERLRAR